HHRDLHSFPTRRSSDLPKIKADKRALKQILLNLLSNAVKFTPRGGRITLRAERDGDGAVRLSVADTGIGIAAEDIPRAMAVFGQDRKSTRLNSSHVKIS